jgi:hypothetical protein
MSEIDTTYHKYIKYKNKYLKSKHMCGGAIENTIYVPDDKTHDVLKYTSIPLVVDGARDEQNIKLVSEYISDYVKLAQLIDNIYLRF